MEKEYVFKPEKEVLYRDCYGNRQKAFLLLEGNDGADFLVLPKTEKWECDCFVFARSDGKEYSDIRENWMNFGR